jgi:hypothetical protein
VVQAGQQQHLSAGFILNAPMASASTRSCVFLLDISGYSMPKEAAAHQQTEIGLGGEINSPAYAAESLPRGLGAGRISGPDPTAPSAIFSSFAITPGSPEVDQRLYVATPFSI